MLRPKQSRGPYLTGIYATEQATQSEAFPFSLPYVRTLDLGLDRPVTFFVGENGSGKSTLLEAVADLSGFQSSGGGRSDVYDDPLAHAPLSRALRPRFRKRPRDGFFFRAENFVNFATLLEERRKDPEFLGNPYGAYGGTSLHEKSHGEAFLSVFDHRVNDGLFLLDEPEAALSPQRQLSLLYIMHDRVKRLGAQFIVATHSPIMLTFPGAGIISFDSPALELVKLEETKHYQITKGVLDNPGRYWKGLLD